MENTYVKKDNKSLEELREAYSILEDFNVGDRVMYINPIDGSTSEGEIRRVTFTNEECYDSVVIISILDDKTLTNIKVLDPKSLLYRVSLI